jgi:hypothetical protein
VADVADQCRATVPVSMGWREDLPIVKAMFFGVSREYVLTEQIGSLGL